MKTVNIAEDYEIFARTGLIAGSSVWSETHVSSYSTGGGGQMHGGTGYVQPSRTHVSSSSTEVSQFFLQLDDGKEIAIKLKDGNIPVRDGQRMTIVFAKPKGAERGSSVWYYNHTTDRFQPDEGGLNSIYDPKPGCAQDTLIGGAIFIGLYIIFRDFLVAALLSVIGLIFVGVSRKNRHAAERKRIVAEIKHQVDILVDQSRQAGAVG